MDISHQEHLVTALHRVLSVAGLLICVLAEVFIFATRRHTATYAIPLLCAILLVYGFHRRAANARIVYLIDFSCLTPPRRLRAPIPTFVEHLKLIGSFEHDGVEFMAKTMEASGMGNETYLPPSLHRIPPDATHGNALKEARMLLLPTLDELFAKTGVPPSAIGALVVCCSGFCPAPSLSAIIANNYRMRSDVKTFNVSGMGCSAGVTGVDIARNVLMTHAAIISYAVVVSTEVVTVGWYNGRDHSKLLLNCFFRTGCSAALVANKRGVAASMAPAKYRLVRLVRTNRIADDESYYSGYREEDDEGITGFNIRRGVGGAFEEVLRAHLVTLGMSILPWREKLRYAKAAVSRSSLTLLLRHGSSPAAVATGGNNNQLTPSFRTAADHFCLPTTWRPMIRRLGQGLGLGDEEMEAALMTFHRFGNQSAASLWYQLAYLEAKGKVRKGDKVWHLGVGTGLKVNSVLWERLHTADQDDLAADRKLTGPWLDCIHRYPVPE